MVPGQEGMPVTSHKNTIHGIISGRFSPNSEAVTVRKFPVSSRGTKILVTVQRLVSSIHEGTVSLKYPLGRRNKFEKVWAQGAVNTAVDVLEPIRSRIIGR